MFEILPGKTPKTKIINVKSFDEGLEAIRWYITESGLRAGINHQMLFEDEDGFHVYLRDNQPCYGEMRPYRKQIPETDIRSQDMKPGDLHDPFPEGKPLALAAGAMGQFRDIPLDFIKPLFDPSVSPWRSVLKGNELLFDKEGKIAGFMWDRSDIPPTPVVQLLMFLRYFGYTLTMGGYHVSPKIWSSLSKLGSHPLTPIYARSKLQGLYGLETFQLIPTNWSYTIHHTHSIPAFFNGHSYDLDQGRTFADRQAYNRPQIGAVFGYHYTPDVLQPSKWNINKKEGLRIEDTKEYFQAVESFISFPIPEKISGDGELPARI